MTEAEAWAVIRREALVVAGDVQTKATARVNRTGWAPREIAILVGLFVKAVSIHKAIHLLCEQSLSNEAHTLLRVMLDTALQLRIFAEERPNDPLIIFKWDHWRVEQWDKSLDVEQVREQVRQVLVDNNKDACELLTKPVWKKIRDATSWIESRKCPGRPAQMSELLPRYGFSEVAYGTLYTFGSAAIHGQNPQDYADLAEQPDGRFTLAVVPPKWVKGCTTLSTRLLIDVQIDVDRLLNCGQRDRLDPLVQRTHDLFVAAADGGEEEAD